MKFKKGDICWVDDFQEFGEALVQLDKRFTKNINGKKLSNPIWECYMLDCKHKGLKEHCDNKDFLLPYDIFEYRLTK